MNIALIAGDDYLNADNRALVFNVRGAPSISGASVQMTVYNGSTQLITKSGTVSVSGVTVQIIYFEFTSAETTALPVGAFTYKVVITLSNGRKVTPVERGQFTVLKRAGE